MIPLPLQLLRVFDLRKVQTITDDVLEQGATLNKTAFSAAQRKTFEVEIRGLDIDVEVVLKFGFDNGREFKNAIIKNIETIFITL